MKALLRREQVCWAFGVLFVKMCEQRHHSFSNIWRITDKCAKHVFVLYNLVVVHSIQNERISMYSWFIFSFSAEHPNQSTQNHYHCLPFRAGVGAWLRIFYIDWVPSFLTLPPNDTHCTLWSQRDFFLNVFWLHYGLWVLGGRFLYYLKFFKINISILIKVWF